MPRSLHILARAAAYAWASPYTVFGITIGLLLGGRFQRVDGVIEIHGRGIAAGLSRMLVPAMAMTLGHVVLGRDLTCLATSRKHERVHVRQYERWGIAFVPAYIAFWLVLSLRGRDGYRDNPFEIEAYAVDDLTTTKEPITNSR
ncbi:hypothetical protein Poly51_42600 [Rubripirellula tenax]|uniref:Signal peptide prediction n=1 Tax=Rubripirellula tenax TaxID=2528015 RepID=A0A5C6ES85_9BACT|nr:hypothetical protein [Rubripirellula tenax]TWU50967.1 hypothetical protein Poly51_42600 [Rubripirellula tenax]